MINAWPRELTGLVERRVADLSSAAIGGVYLTEQGELSHIPRERLYWQAVTGALDDAGLTFADIDGWVGEPPAGVGLREKMPGGALADLLGHPLRFEAMTHIGASSGSACVGLAAIAIAHGLADVIVVATAASGQAQTGYMSADRAKVVEHMAKLGSPYEWLWGTTRVADYAVIARRHMYEYGTTSEQLAEIAVAQRHGATLHPLSVMGHRGEITVDDVLSSRMIADPLHLLDSCIINQGGGAMVVARAAAVRDAGRHAPVVVAGWGEGHGYLDPNSAPSLTAFAGRHAADTAFSMAGVTRDEIDVVGMSDHFTINVLIGLEDAGFCAKGEGGQLVDKGGLAVGGTLPTNTAGGFMSFSHAGSCGLYTMIEVVQQLRHDAGPRQVAGARLGYTHGMGGVFQTHYGAVLARA
jgi:acetyl-CoA acetyltransferase